MRLFTVPEHLHGETETQIDSILKWYQDNPENLKRDTDLCKGERFPGSETSGYQAQVTLSDKVYQAVHQTIENPKTRITEYIRWAILREMGHVAYEDHWPTWNPASRTPLDPLEYMYEYLTRHPLPLTVKYGAYGKVTWNQPTTAMDHRLRVSLDSNIHEFLLTQAKSWKVSKSEFISWTLIHSIGYIPRQEYEIRRQRKMKAEAFARRNT